MKTRDSDGVEYGCGGHRMVCNFGRELLLLSFNNNGRERATKLILLKEG